MAKAGKDGVDVEENEACACLMLSKKRNFTWEMNGEFDTWMILRLKAMRQQ